MNKKLNKLIKQTLLLTGINLMAVPMAMSNISDHTDISSGGAFEVLDMYEVGNLGVWGNGGIGGTGLGGAFGYTPISGGNLNFSFTVDNGFGLKEVLDCKLLVSNALTQCTGVADHRLFIGSLVNLAGSIAIGIIAGPAGPAVGGTYGAAMQINIAKGFSDKMRQCGSNDREGNINCERLM